MPRPDAPNTRFLDNEKGPSRWKERLAAPLIRSATIAAASGERSLTSWPAK
jgi:hypothetical protein